MDHPYTYTNRDHISVEVNSGSFSTSLLNLDFFDSFNDGILFDGTCDPTELAQSINPIPFDADFPFPFSANTVFDTDSNQLALNDFPSYSVEQPKKKKSNKKTIPLSSSVGVDTSQQTLNGSYKFEVVNELEETYRPRYKTDYFALNGLKRKPRYVTDRHGNHYITIRVPSGICGRVRIDWLTIPDENGDRFVMPYRFQIDNDSAKTEDLNPVYEDFASNVPGGILKLYLVLIKAKQDALKTLQPLQVFRPMHNALGFHYDQNLDKTVILSPKKLIQKYQLGKSQLAFTLCRLDADGQTYVTEWDTTVYSTVIEEESTDNSSGKFVSCPNCLTEINVDDDFVIINDGGVSKRKSLPVIGQKPKTIKKQRSINTPIFSFD